MKKRWTVKEVCELTGLTGKHLYYFHHQGVVRAVEFSNYSVEGHNGYKLYDDVGVAKLQQIAMYYELGLKQNEIRDLMTSKDYDMHRALDELQQKLEEKRIRLERHIAAIEQLRLIGTKNGLLEMFNGLSLDDLGKNALVVSQSSIAELWGSLLDERSIEKFNASFEDLLCELSKLDTQSLSSELGTRIIGDIIQSAIDHLGFPGYMLIFSMFISAIGEGSMTDEIASELPITIIPEHGKAVLCYLKQDAEMFLKEAAQIIACHHDVIGGPFDSPETIKMVLSIKNLLASRYGLKHEEEYRLLFELLDIKQCNGNQDYLGYTLNALKYHSVSKNKNSENC